MENYFTDRWRASRPVLEGLRTHFTAKVAGRRAIVAGSAPDPVFPEIRDQYLLSVNGSAYSLARYTGRSPDATFLNVALFRDKGLYSAATWEALRDRHVGDVVLNAPSRKKPLETLKAWGVSHGAAFPITKYEKRVILGDVAGHTPLGMYRHDANISNGLFMAAFALWCGASEAVLVGFSFNDRHAYADGQRLSHRAHQDEDARFLRLCSARRLAITTTSTEIVERFGLVPPAGI